MILQENTSKSFPICWKSHPLLLSLAVSVLQVATATEWGGTGGHRRTHPGLRGTGNGVEISEIPGHPQHWGKGSSHGSQHLARTRETVYKKHMSSGKCDFPGWQSGRPGPSEREVKVAA